MRIANSPSVVSFTLDKHDKYKLEQALGAGPYKFTVIKKDLWKVIARDPKFKKHYGDGYLKLGKINRKRSEKLFRVSIHNMDKSKLGKNYAPSEGTMKLKSDSYGPYMEFFIPEENKLPFRSKNQRSAHKTKAEKMQSIPLPVPITEDKDKVKDDPTITLDQLFAARRLINQIANRFQDQMTLSINDQTGELTFKMEASLTEQILSGMISKTEGAPAKIKSNGHTNGHDKSLEVEPVIAAPAEEPANEMITVPGKTVVPQKGGILGFFRGRRATG